MSNAHIFSSSRPRQATTLRTERTLWHVPEGTHFSTWPMTTTRPPPPHPLWDRWVVPLASYFALFVLPSLSLLDRFYVYLYAFFCRAVPQRRCVLQNSTPKCRNLSSWFSTTTCSKNKWQTFSSIQRKCHLENCQRHKSQKDLLSSRYFYLFFFSVSYLHILLFSVVLSHLFFFF